jgi:hypothetical protein
LRLFHRSFVTAPLLARSAFAPAHASLIINATFDSATSGALGSSRTQTQNTINSVIRTYQNEILNSITVNVNFQVDQSVPGSTLFTACAVPYDTYLTQLTSPRGQRGRFHGARSSSGPRHP